MKKQALGYVVAGVIISAIAIPSLVAARASKPELVAKDNWALTMKEDLDGTLTVLTDGPKPVWQVIVLRPSKDPSDVALINPLTTQNTTLKGKSLTFRVRAETPHTIIAAVNGWHKSFRVSPEWTQYTVEMPSTASASQGVQFLLAGTSGEVDIADIHLS